jgi:hypothetical protein
MDMQNRMKLLAGAALVLGLVLSGASTTLAGQSTPWQVSVNRFGDGSGSGSGTFTGARRSSDSRQYIYCTATHFASGTSWAFCSAMNSAGDYIACSWSNPTPTILTAIESLGAQSYFSFQVNTDGTCAHMGVSQSSLYLP